MDNQNFNQGNWWVDKSLEAQEKEKLYQKAKRRAEISRQNGARGGRKPANIEARERHLNILLTRQEYDAIKERSKFVGLTMSEYLRRVGQDIHISTETELEILKCLYDYRNNFVRIANMYHYREDLIAIAHLVTETANAIKLYIHDLQSKNGKGIK